MEATFTIGNKLYNENTATITFKDDPATAAFPTSGSNAAAAATCWIVDYIAISASKVTTCTAGVSAAADVYITNIKASAANTQFKFRILAELNGTTTSGITRIQTSSGSNVIDETSTGSALATFTRGTLNLNSAATTEMGIALVETGGSGEEAVFGLVAGGTTGITNASLAGLKFQFQTTKSYSDETVTTIKLPLVTDAPSNTAWYCTSDTYTVYVGSGAGVDSGFVSGNTPLDAAANGASNIGAVMQGSANGLGSITITNTTGNSGVTAPATDAHYVGILIGTGDITATKVTTNPRVSSNDSTYYEVWIKAEKTDSAAKNVS